MTKLKQLTPYLLLVVLSFFVANFISMWLWGWGRLENIGDYFFDLKDNSYLFPTIITIIAYILYMAIHNILKKVLPIHIYKKNKKVKILAFFFIFTSGWILVDALFRIFILGIY